MGLKDEGLVIAVASVIAGEDGIDMVANSQRAIGLVIKESQSFI